MLASALLFATLLSASICIDPESELYKEVFTYHNQTFAKAEYAFEVVEKIFNAFKQWFFTITFCEFTYFENRILKYTENYGYGYPVMLLNGCPDIVKTKVKPRINRHGTTAYLVTSNELSLDGSEFVIEALIRTGVFKPRSAVIFVINTPVDMDSYFLYTMKLHFHLLLSKSITNSVMILYSGRLRMYTYNPFKNEIKDITDVKDVSGLLIRQYNDLSGHELRLSVYRKVYVSDEAGPVYCNSKLAETVMKILNATCKPLTPRDGNTVGDLLPNGTATGVTADLIDGYTDLELSSRILKNSYYGYIDTTYPLVQDELCFLIKKSLRQSTFTTTLKLISVDMLLLCIFNVIFFITVALIVRGVEKGIWNLNDRRNSSSTVVDLVKCFIRQTVDMKFTGPIFRVVVFLIMIYSLVVDCAVDGIITSAIAYPRYKPDINTLPELVHTNLTFAVHNRHLRIYKRSLSPEYYNIISKRTKAFNDDKIKEAIVKRQFQYALLLRKTDAQYISRQQSNMDNGRPLFHTVEECPVPCSIVYGLRYGSPYLPKLNNILHHLNQGGILQYWSKSEDFAFYQSNAKSLYAEENKERKPLSGENVMEIFIVLFIGLSVSVLAFSGEILLYYIARRRKN
ncbi:uncharacterized protein [Battus philenor]|uniref:uncharacterized protein n=1 Tax=Battus philenor TaxID=42288 RepID=UPI0035D05F4E